MMTTGSFEISINNFPFIRVAVVDDHKVVTNGLETVINASDVARVIAKAYSATGCLEMLQACQPDVLMLDISLPDGNGIDLYTQIKELYPEIKALMLTSYGELTTITRALDAGAHGYILKNAMPEEIIEGIRTVASGKRFLCEEANTTLRNNENSLLELTRREIEMLRLIVEGFTQTEIADKMCLGIQTIRSYRKNLNLKLNAHNTAQLVLNAKGLGFV
jgi:DNA-binding NarL/FixJ family response regulator